MVICFYVFSTCTMQKTPKQMAITNYTHTVCKYKIGMHVAHQHYWWRFFFFLLFDSFFFLFQTLFEWTRFFLSCKLLFLNSIWMWFWFWFRISIEARWTRKKYQFVSGDDFQTVFFFLSLLRDVVFFLSKYTCNYFVFNCLVVIITMYKCSNNSCACPEAKYYTFKENQIKNKIINSQQKSNG